MLGKASIYELANLAPALFCLIPAIATPARAQNTVAPVPRVLIIGDSIYSNHTRELPKLLKGRVEVVYASWNPGEIADTATTIELLDRHLGRIDRNGKPVDPDKWPRWDLIHFNCGLGDLIHRAPGMKTFRVLPIHVGGVRNTPPVQYANNLRTLVTALRAKAPEATLVWASTTPIRASANNAFEKGSEIEYNDIAANVMQKNSVRTNEMYTFVRHLINMDKPASHGADPFSFEKKPIHMPIARIIEDTFHLPRIAETEEEKASRENAAASNVKL